MRCRSCGLPADAPLCARCAPAAEFLHSDAAERSLSLRIATPDQRPLVFLAMLRGGALWESAGPELLGWMTEEQTGLLFNRWLAEDAVYGGMALKNLARTDRTRCLTRAPLWLAPHRPASSDMAALLIGTSITDVPWLYALAFRLGASADSAETRKAWQAIFPAGVRPLIQATMRFGRPAEDRWLPDAAQLSATPRRWPIERLEEEGVVVCAVCGECLPASGPCRWCQTDPEDEPPMILRFSALFQQRDPCKRCELDLTTAAAPGLCPGCGLEDPLR
ncbi:MAG: hypothetical protein ACI8RZ_003105 [Myxococcota bacterium]|jgi:hypothetical protein